MEFIERSQVVRKNASQIDRGIFQNTLAKRNNDRRVPKAVGIQTKLKSGDMSSCHESKILSSDNGNVITHTATALHLALIATDDTAWRIATQSCEFLMIAGTHSY